MAGGLKNLRELEIKTAKHALLKHCGAGLTEVQVTRADIPSFRAQFPEYEDSRVPRWEDRKKDPSMNNWPATDEPKLVGLAWCHILLQSPRVSVLEAYKINGKAAGQFAAANELFQDIWNLDYWTFIKKVGIPEHEARKYAIEKKMIPVYIWPSRASHLIYVANAPAMREEYKGVGKCKAVAGYFTVDAIKDADARVHGEAFFLLEDGAIIPRKEWESKYLGFNQSQFMIHYIAKDKLSDEEPYEGLICASRVDRGAPIVDNPKNLFRRTFKGKIHVLGSGEKKWDGLLYAEEVDFQGPDSLKGLFREHHEKLCSKVGISD